MLTTTLFFIGSLLLALLSIRDFKDKVFDRGKFARYYISMILFICINLIIYSAICIAAIGIDASDLLTGLRSNEKDLNIQILPTIITFAYFGLGSINIPYGDKAISFYGVILKLFQGMFSIPNVDLINIQKEIETLNRESKQFEKAIEDFNSMQEIHGGEILAEQWKDINQDKVAIAAHIDSLDGIHDNLDFPTLTKEKIKKINKQLESKKKELTADINEKLKKHIRRLLDTNRNNHAALDDLLATIGLKMPLTPSKPHVVSFCRALVFSIFTGVIIGSLSLKIFGVTSDMSDINRIWAWVVGLSFFGVTFSLITRVKKEPRDGFVWAAIIGGAAGVIGQLWLKLVPIIFGVKGLDSLALSIFLYGFIFGAAISLLIHFFRYFVRSKVNNCFLCYLLIAFSGAAIFVLLGIILPLDVFNNLKLLWFLVLIGSFVTVIVSVITNIFHSVVND